MPFIPVDSAPVPCGRTGAFSDSTQANPGEAQWWVQWAYALRENGKVAEAKAVALLGLKLHPEEAILHYNLACYLSLLGELEQAKVELRRSIKLDRPFQKAAAQLAAGAYTVKVEGVNGATGICLVEVYWVE